MCKPGILLSRFFPHSSRRFRLVLRLRWICGNCKTWNEGTKCGDGEKKGIVRTCAWRQREWATTQIQAEKTERVNFLIIRRYVRRWFSPTYHPLPSRLKLLAVEWPGPAVRTRPHTEAAQAEILWCTKRQGERRPPPSPLPSPSIHSRWLPLPWPSAWSPGLWQ